MKDFFTKNKTLVIAVIAILILAILIFLFKDNIKSLFSKEIDNAEATAAANKVNSTVTTFTQTTNTYGNSEIGKSVYAKVDGVKVLYKTDASTFRTKNKNAFVGVIAGNATLGGSPFYSIGKGLVVAKNKVYIK